MEAVHRFTHAAMATRFEIRCVYPDENYARQASRFAFEVADRLERQLSRFVENSDISRINHLLPGEYTRIGYETMQCLELARFISTATGNAFDISLGTGFERLEIIPEEFTVGAPAGGAQLDLGAVGKGYAVDRMAETLNDWEITHVLIDAGYSSVLALEPPPGSEAWPLTISDPGSIGRPALAHIAAKQRALGASGIQKRDHIRDPRTRAAVRSRQAAWVSAPRQVLEDICRQAGVEPSPAAVADALSTAFMILSPEEIQGCCSRYPGLEAWILETNLLHFGSQIPWGPVQRSRFRIGKRKTRKQEP